MAISQQRRMQIAASMQLQMHESKIERLESENTRLRAELAELVEAGRKMRHHQETWKNYHPTQDASGYAGQLDTMKMVYSRVLDAEKSLDAILQKHS